MDFKSMDLLKFKLTKTIKKINFNSIMSEQFPEPVFFTLSHKEHNFLQELIIANFQKSELTYYSIMSDENIKLMEEHKVSKYLLHNHISIGNKGMFSSYLLRSNDMFNFIDFEECAYYVLSVRRIFEKDCKIIGETMQLDTNNPGHILLNILSDEDGLETYSCSYDLKELIKISTIPDYKHYPHEIKTYKNFMYLPEFYKREFITEENEILYDEKELENYIYKNPWVSQETIKPIILYMAKKFRALPGYLGMYDNENKILKYIRTDTTPAHIQFLDDFAYVSAHNFFKIRDKQTYIDPATITKYKITENGLEFINKFKDAKGYRLTNYELFKIDDHPYLVTIGFPNKLYFIDGITMTKISEVDLSNNDILNKNKDNIVCSINNKQIIENDTFSKFEISEDKKWVLLIGPINLTLLNLFNLKEPLEKIVIEENILKEDFSCITLHSTKMKE